MEAAKLILLTLAALCGYGAALGEVSAWICPEAFTLGRPAAFGALPALVLGPIWGALDFLIPSGFIGVAMAMAAHFGGRPAIKAFFFYRPLACLVALAAIAASVAGALGYHAVLTGAYPILGPMEHALTPQQHPLLAAVWWAMLGSHFAVLAGGIVLAVWTWKKRAVFEEIVRQKSR